MTARLARPVVLVVDDEATVRETIRLVLDEDFEVLEAPDGRSAVELAGGAPIDLVLLDLRMPEADGFTVLTELHKRRPGLPIVIVSGLDRADAAATALREGAVDYLTKPFEIARLLSTVRTALGPRSARGMRPADRAIATCVGCHVTVAAALAATLAPDVEVQSHVDPPPPGTLARDGPPSALIVDTHGRSLDWIGQAGLLADRLPGVACIVLAGSDNAVEARFAFGDRGVFLESPPRLARLLDLVWVTLRDQPARRPGRDPRMAGLIEAVCREHADFSLQRTARRLGISPYYLSRQFGAHAGLTLNAYLKRVRIYAARYLLEHTDMKVQAIAGAVGFHDASHLSDAFHEVTGQRPGQYRSARRAEGNGTAL